MILITQRAWFLLVFLGDAKFWFQFLTFAAYAAFGLGDLHAPRTLTLNCVSSLVHKQRRYELSLRDGTVTTESSFSRSFETKSSPPALGNLHLKNKPRVFPWFKGGEPNVTNVMTTRLA